MIIRLVCLCGASARATVDRDKLPPGVDGKAAALQAAAQQGWKYRGGRIGKSVITVECPKCRPERLHLEADFPAADVIPGTYEKDLAPEPADGDVVLERGSKPQGDTDVEGS